MNVKQKEKLSSVVDFIQEFNHHRMDKNYDDIYIYNGIEWKDYQQLLQDIGNVSFCNISYFNRVLEIMSPGKNHELIKELTGILIVAFCDEKEIDYIPFGSTTLKNKNKQAGKEPDISYAIGEDKEIPDIAVEVNYSSGGLDGERGSWLKSFSNHRVDDLAIYLAIGVKEVWIWDKDNDLYFYVLENNQYIKKTESVILSPLKSKTVQKYVKIMTQKTPRIGKKEFIEYIKK